ncbi:MAG: 4-(cytidine 5'-diphospho)-2-C-methyl-D-erythritol kinase [Lachnospiraceae bacterium]|nr:4-(cytidine 5'-diphospho)-2-C-methyl-D-erythritol kinase [Lachnospiraceae bacterium]
MEVVDIFARAKINLSLDVIGRRPNGYHDVRMIMQSIDLHDDISLYRSKGSGNIIIEEASGSVPLNKDNLIYKAAAVMMDKYHIKDDLRVVLKKNIPVAAGMAGGSTDAAAIFKALNIMYELNLTVEELCSMGVKVGADVPYCIMGGTALSEGIGEILTPIIAMPYCDILIAKPDISVSTAYVYNEFDKLEEKKHPDVSAMSNAIKEQDIRKISKLLGNSLEGVTIQKYPIIEEIKENMLGKGAIGALMSGSGPTVFGLFDSMNKAVIAADHIRGLGIAKDIILTKPYNAQ